MPLRRCLAALVAFIALAAPGAALAQSAGDDQYQDPFGGSGGSGSPGSGGSSSGGSSTSAPSAPPSTAPTSSSTAPAPAPSASAPSASASQAVPAGTSGSQLPFSGSPVDAGLLAAAGGVLLAGGLTLRVRLRERDGA